MSEVQPLPKSSFTSGALRFRPPLKGEVGGASHPGVLTSLTLAMVRCPRSGPRTTRCASPLSARSRARGNPALKYEAGVFQNWIPACAGMSEVAGARACQCPADQTRSMLTHSAMVRCPRSGPRTTRTTPCAGTTSPLSARSRASGNPALKSPARWPSDRGNPDYALLHPGYTPRLRGAGSARGGWCSRLQYAPQKIGRTCGATGSSEAPLVSRFQRVRPSRPHFRPTVSASVLSASLEPIPLRRVCA